LLRPAASYTTSVRIAGLVFGLGPLPQTLFYAVRKLSDRCVIRRGAVWFAIDPGRRHQHIAIRRAHVYVASKTLVPNGEGSLEIEMLAAIRG
jgi:hypothetical protein